MKKSTYKIVVVFLLTTSCLLSNFSHAQYTKLYDFASGADGSDPIGSLFSMGSFLYGTAWQGGTNGYGAIFKIKPDGTGYSKLYDFSGTIDGGRPKGSLISDGTFLYGMTYQGGTNDFGVIFKIMPDGTGYSKLLDFAGVSNGKWPVGDLFFDGTFLYGITSSGGTNNMGTIFKIMPDGTGYSMLLDFVGITNGRDSYGSLISDGVFFYGMTYQGGTNDNGTIFKIKSDGTGYVKLLDFDGVANGSKPNGSLISDGTFLYGMTQQGGINNYGTIFKIKPDGTDYAKLFDFSGTVDGDHPNSFLVSDGTFLYGMTYAGGAYNQGVIFKIKPDGTGYSNLLDFNGTVNGSNPNGYLISDSTFLYGMTYQGGTNNVGTIFKYAPLTTGIVENNMTTGFNIYPNPNNGTFTIAATKNDYKLIITNVLGAQVYQSETNNQKQEIDLSKQPYGIYFLNIKTEKGTLSKKLIINK